MYYKEERENYTSNNTIEKVGDKSSKFPTWLLIVIITFIVAIGLGLIFMLRHEKKKTQNFGFRFY